MHLIESAPLAGTGVGYADVHLLVSARLSRAMLWSRDKRLIRQAERLGLAAPMEAKDL